MRLKAYYPHIRLILVLPCVDQTYGWNLQDIVRYHAILAAVNNVVYTDAQDRSGCMHRRNRHLVDRSSVCVAYCTKSTGGSVAHLSYHLTQLTNSYSRGMIILHLVPVS